MSVDGVENDDRLSNSRAGLTVAIPVDRSNSIKIYGISGVSTQNRERLHDRRRRMAVPLGRWNLALPCSKQRVRPPSARAKTAKYARVYACLDCTPTASGSRCIGQHEAHRLPSAQPVASAVRPPLARGAIGRLHLAVQRPSQSDS